MKRKLNTKVVAGGARAMLVVQVATAGALLTMSRIQLPAWHAITSLLCLGIAAVGTILVVRSPLATADGAVFRRTRQVEIASCFACVLAAIPSLIALFQNEGTFPFILLFVLLPSIGDAIVWTGDGPPPPRFAQRAAEQ